MKWQSVLNQVPLVRCNSAVFQNKKLAIAVLQEVKQVKYTPNEDKNNAEFHANAIRLD